MEEDDRDFDLPRLEGEDIFEYFDRFAARLKSIDHGPNGNFERDLLVAIAIGDLGEAERIGEVLKRKNAARMKIIK